MLCFREQGGIRVIDRISAFPCVLMNNVETFTSYIHVTLTLLRRIWRWTTTYFAWSCSRKSEKCKKYCHGNKKCKEIDINTQQSTVVVELLM